MRDDLPSSAVRIGADLWRLLALSVMQPRICPQPDEPAYVVGQIGHADFHPGAGYADRAHDEAHWSFLMREHVLDRAADFGFLRVGDTHALRHRPAWRLLAMDVRHQPAPREHCFVFRRPVGVSAQTSLAVFVRSRTS